LNLFNEPVDWNSELIKEMRPELSERWNMLERSLYATSLEIRVQIKERLRGLKLVFMGEYLPRVIERMDLSDIIHL
jgi:hypothetical protein